MFFGRVLKGEDWWMDGGLVKNMRQKRSWYSGDHLTFTPYATCLQLWVAGTRDITVLVAMPP